MMKKFLLIALLCLQHTDAFADSIIVFPKIDAKNRPIVCSYYKKHLAKASGSYLYKRAVDLKAKGEKLNREQMQQIEHVSTLRSVMRKAGCQVS